MRRFILFIVAMLCMAAAYAQSFDSAPKGKTAILMVHFGTTFDDTRSATIDAINEKAKEQFPEVKVIEAYTSRIIINRLKNGGSINRRPKKHYFGLPLTVIPMS